MFLFFGTRPGKQISQKLDGVRCTYCSQTNTMTANTCPNFFHLFWIPIFRIGTSRVAKCSHCKKVYDKEEFSGEMKRRLR